MSAKIRRQKDIIKNSTQSYLDAVTDYQDYYDGASPILITYYQISDEASRTDTALEDVHEVVGTNTPLKYFRIKHLPARGMSSLDISNQLTQRGLESFISGEFVLSPSAGLTPKSGEFFTYEDDVTPELNQHLFIITDVQFDRATSKKFYKCTYKLYPLDADNIYHSVIKNFVYNPKGLGNTDGVGDSVLITEEENDLNEAIDNLTDGLIDKFEELFYDEGMDTFVYQKSLDQTGTNFSYYWSPYICHFIYKNNILEKSNREFLTEIYVQDINEREFPNIYSEEGYRNSIFHAVEVGDSGGLENVSSSFMEVSAYDLSKPLNLPFFTSGEKYYLLDTNHKFNRDFWLGSFNWIYDDEDHLYKDIDGLYRYYGNLEEYLKENNLTDDLGNVIPEAYDKVVEKTFYQMQPNTNGIENINSMIRIPSGETSFPYECDIYNMINSDIYFTDINFILNKVINYLRSPDKFRINETLLAELNDIFYQNTIQNYILMPLIIYILQNSKGEVIDERRSQS